MGEKTPFYCDISAVHQGVTGSNLIVTIHFPNKSIKRFGVDCGLYQERKYDFLNSKLFYNPKEIDFMLVTHAHADHIGRIPLLVKNGFCGDIYCTKTTAKILPFALNDSYQVLKDQASRSKTSCIYHSNDVSNCLSLVKPCKYGKKIKIDENISVTFFMNGHLVGASIILVTIRSSHSDDSINLLFTGDYKNNNIFFNVKDLPDSVKNLPITIVSESTYGSTFSSDTKKVFSNNILAWLNKPFNKVGQEFRGGSLYLPVFSLGRAQEILYLLRQLQDTGLVKPNIPIYLDGKLACNYCNLYKHDGLDNDTKKMHDLYPIGFSPATSFITKSNRISIMQNPEQKIVLFTSGMCSYGAARTWIPYGFKRSDVMIHLTGFCAEGTLSRKLLEAAEGAKTEMYGGQKVTKRCTIMSTNEFSGHAKANDLLDLFKQFTNLKCILLNHGDSSVKKQFKSYIEDQIDIKNCEILDSNSYRISPYGLVKSVSNDYLPEIYKPKED